MDNSYLKTEKQVLTQLNTKLTGLTSEECQDRLSTHGKNELIEKKGPTMFELVLEQFKDQLVIILLVSAFISFILAALEEDQNGYVEPIVILLILIANAIVGVVQETNAENAIAVIYY
jgi:Ca2+ transporting ATPase